MDFTRQVGILHPNKLTRPIHIVGCGSVGSWTALTLAKMGASNLVLWDFDTVEPHNIPNQAFLMGDINAPKAEALQKVIAQMTGYTPVSRPTRCLPTDLHGFVILAVDSLKMRKAIFSEIKLCADIRWVIDARMGAEVGRIFAVERPVEKSCTWYETTLDPVNGVIEAPCTAKSTAYCAVGLSGFVANKIAKIVTNRPVQKELVIDFPSATVLAPRDPNRVGG